MAEPNPFRVLFLAGENGRFGGPLQNYLKNCRKIDFETRPDGYLSELTGQ